MNKTDVLVKTARGAEEISTRAHGLDRPLRALLIVVDGKQTVGTLAQRLAGLGDIEASLGKLLAQGFVEVAGAVTAVAPQGGAPDTGPGPGETREQAVSGLCGLLHELLGPDADDFTGQLERARTRNEFLAALERAHSMVEGIGGAKRAVRLNDRGMLVASRYFAG